MLEKYRATIHGNTIEWDGNPPKGVDLNEVITVDVTLVQTSAADFKAPNGRKAVEALEKLAAMGGVKSIPNPDEWLRETRKDRPLPGRE